MPGSPGVACAECPVRRVLHPGAASCMPVRRVLHARCGAQHARCGASCMPGAARPACPERRVLPGAARLCTQCVMYLLSA
jgi:hypothetical protein